MEFLLLAAAGLLVLVLIALVNLGVVFDLALLTVFACHDFTVVCLI